MKRGRYAVLEGIDGSGKTTQTELVIKKLADIGIEAISVYEPGGGTEMGREIRQLLKEGPDREPGTNACLFNAARVEALTQIKHHILSGRWVICDRNRLSTFAYQGHGEGVDLKLLHRLDVLIHDLVGINPDLEMIFKVTPAVAATRLKQRGTVDYFEKLGADFADRVRDGYVREARRLNLPVINADPSIEEVFGHVWGYIQPLLPKGE